jgi:single-stranded-DNA-specific exonuclease
MSLTPRNEISILSSVTHHRPGQNLPEAIAVLDPKETTVIILMMNCVDGIGFKLIQALGLNQDRR